MIRRIISIALATLPGLILLPVWLNYGLGASEDDILYYLPSRAYLQTCFNAGEWPLFNHWNGLGRPFLADPQNATFYPFTWLFYVLPLKFAYPAHLWAHFAIAALGTYRLARGMRLRRVAAVFAAITFAFGGFMISHRVHFAMQASAAWLPWIIWQQDRLLRLLDLRRLQRVESPETSTNSSIRAATSRNTIIIIQSTSLLAIIIALQCFAGHFQMVLLTLFACAILFVFRNFKPQAPAPGSTDAGSSNKASRNQEFDQSRPDRDRDEEAQPTYEIKKPPRIRSISSGALCILAAWLLAVAIFTVQWLPTAKYARTCDRADWSYWEFTQNSYELPSLLTFLNPFIFGNRVPNATVGPYWGPSHQCEQLSFVGIAALLLVLPALRSDFRARAKRKRWFALLVASAVLALGRYGPLCPLLWLLPGSEAFRGPARGLLLMQLALAILAATVIDDLARPLSPTRARMRAALVGIRKRWPLVAGILIFAPYLLAWAAVPWLSQPARDAALQTLAAARLSHLLIPISAVMALLALGFVAKNWQKPAYLWLLPIVAVVELSIVGWVVDVPRDRVDFVQTTRPDIENYWLGFTTQDDRRLWTVTTKDGKTPGEYLQSLAKCVARTNMFEPKQILTDYGPLQPKNFVSAFEMELWGEARSPASLLTNAALLRAARVGWILVCDDSLPAPVGSRPVTTTPEGFRLFVNDDCVPPVWFLDGGVAAAAQISWHSNAEGTIQYYCESSRSSAENSRQTLAISLLATPGWTAWHNEVQLQTSALHDVFVAIELPQDESGVIHLRYRAPGLRAGAIVTAIALLAAFAVLTSTAWGRFPTRRANAA